MFEQNVCRVPHAWNTAVGLAADLHLSAALPVASHVRDLTPSPCLDEISTEPFTPDAEGFLNVPDSPGLGIRVNGTDHEAASAVSPDNADGG